MAKAVERKEQPQAFSHSHHDARYASSMEQLVQTVQQLSQAQDLATIMSIVRQAARELTGADGATFVLREGDQCYYAEENAITPLWKGKRFPMSACISGWVMLHKKQAIIKDVYSDDRIPQDAYRPTFVKSLVMVPIRKNAPIGAIGNYWAKKREATQEEIHILQALADTTSVALENVSLYHDLRCTLETVQKREAKIRKQHDTLEIFTHALAHDLKEPVRTITAYANLIAQECLLSEQAQRFFSHIQDAGKKMLHLIERVFLYIQYESYKNVSKSRCNMNDLVHEAIENIQQLIQETHAQITYQELPTLPANQALITQLLKNLIVNAIYYNHRVPQIHITAEERKNVWLFKVSDNGIGLEKKNLKRIFLPFKRIANDSRGTGLGLAICKQVIDSHNGQIWCESELDKGSVFVFTLPKLINHHKAAKHSQIINIKTNNKLANILLVDDMESDLELTEILFSRAHIVCNLFKTKNAEEAIQLLKQKHQQNDPVDLILLDINMPGMDGFEMLQHIRAEEELKQTPVIMFSGSAYEKDKNRAFRMGAVGYVIKPLEVADLKSVIKSIDHLKWSKTKNKNVIQRIVRNH